MQSELNDVSADQDIMVTAVIKAKNEAENILECIDSLRPLVDEIIVVDDASQDQTANLAMKAGAIVIQGNPHGGNINALDVQGFLAARGTYILRLDADERLTPGLAEVLRSTAIEGQWAGVRYARRYWFFDGWLDHGGWFRSQQLGFFRSDSWDTEWDMSLHSQVPVIGEVKTLNASREICMLHYDYFTIHEFITRSLLNYAKVEAQERVRAGYKFSVASVGVTVARRSVGRFFLRGGYKDGRRGAVVAGLLGAYEVCIAAYAWEIKRTR